MNDETLTDDNGRITVGRYELLYEISSGGMGTVFRGRDTDLDRAVAVKMLSKDIFTSIDHQLRFIQEAKIIAKLDHPNIMRIYGIEYSDENAYLVMEYLSGKTLDEIIDSDGAFSYENAKELLSQLAEALSHAHSRGVVHLDIKPSNILIQDEDGSLKLMDFGISKDKNEDFNLALSEDTSVGSPKYMSPEQLTGSPVDLRSDIYSFGILAYEILAGYPPFEAEGLSEYRELHLHSMPVSLRKRTNKIPKKLLNFISACMEKSPDKRPESLEDFAEKISENVKGDKLSISMDKRKAMIIAIASSLVFLLFLFFILKKSGEKEVETKHRAKPKIDLSSYIKEDKKKKSVNINKNNNKVSAQISEEEKLKAKQSILDELHTINAGEKKKDKKNEEKPASSAEKDKKAREKSKPVVPIVTFLTTEQTAAIINESVFKKDIENLTLKGKRSGMDKESLYKCINEMRKNDLQKIIPLLQSGDAVLVKNIADVLSYRQFEMAIPAIQARLQNENNEMLAVFLVEALGNFFSPEANKLLNEFFLENDSPAIMIAAMKSLEGRASSKTIEKAETLKIVAEDEHFMICIDAFISSMGGSVDVSNAFDAIRSENKKSLPPALRVIRYTGSKRELKELDRYRRSMYKNLNIMREYLITNAVLSTLHIKKTRTRFDKMVAHANKDESVISWFIFRALRSLSKESISWARDALMKYEFEEEPLFIISQNGLPRVDELMRDIEEKKKQDLEKSAQEKEELTGKIRFVFPDDNIQVKIDGRAYAIPAGKEVSFPIGKHILELSYDSSIPTKREVELTDSGIIEVIAKRPPLIFSNSLGMRMAHIPQGEVTCSDISSNTVNIQITRPFYASAYEVKNIEYEQFDPFHASQRDKYSPDDESPVIMVTWEDAVKFCNWLSKKEKLEPCYDQDYKFDYSKGGYRLLTEAEWLYLASAGVRSYKYPWGDEEKRSVANLAVDGNDDFEFTSPAGSFAPNIFGLYDLGGNVAEWCTDWYSYSFPVEKNGSFSDPVNLEESDFKVYRGGSWYDDNFSSVTEREYAEIFEKSNRIGFRVARTSEQFSIDIREIRKPD